jgi:hypothetical protein
MTKPFDQWTVLPHGELTRLEDNLLCVTGWLDMPPMGKVQRRMSVVRLGDGRGVVYSAIALDEAKMQELARFATPTYLVVPNGIHRMDSNAWRNRYPEITVIAPRGARDRVERIVHVDATEVDFGDPAVRLITVPGTAEREAALVVESAAGSTTVIVSDLVFDLRNRPGLSGWFFKKLGMTGDEPRLPALVKKRLVDREQDLRRQLEHWANLPSLRRVVIAHGNIIGDHPGQALRHVARRLQS